MLVSSAGKAALFVSYDLLNLLNPNVQSMVTIQKVITEVITVSLIAIHTTALNYYSYVEPRDPAR